MRRIVAVIVLATGILVALPSYPVDASRAPDLQCGVNPTSSVRLRARTSPAPSGSRSPVTTHR